MGLFSKEECCFCGNKVGMLSRKKLTDIMEWYDE